MRSNEYKAEVKGQEIIIRLPIKQLVDDFNSYDDGYYRITDKKKFAQYIADNILEFGEDSETGLSEFRQMLDKLFETAIEDEEEFFVEIE